MPTSEAAVQALALLEKDKSKALGVTLPNGTSVEPGLHVPRADAKRAPKISLALPNPSATYILVNVDLDAPFPSFPFLGPILHWLQPGLKATPGGDGTALEATEPVICDYVGPGPPPGSSPHRYVFLLYEQPEGFNAKPYAPAGVSGRMRFGFDEFVRGAGLGSPVAVNYFTSN